MKDRIRLMAKCYALVERWYNEDSSNNYRDDIQILATRILRLIEKKSECRMCRSLKPGEKGCGCPDSRCSVHTFREKK